MNGIRVHCVRTAVLLLFLGMVGVGLAAPAVAHPAPTATAVPVRLAAAKPLCTLPYPASTVSSIPARAGSGCTPQTRCTTERYKKRGKWKTRRVCTTLNYI